MNQQPTNEINGATQFGGFWIRVGAYFIDLVVLIIPVLLVSLGFMYYDGEVVPKDASQAVTWFRKAAEQGHADAQFNLGVMYATGVGVPKDYVQAAKWFYLAKANGVAKTDEVIRLIESEMSRQQIEQAQALATQWWQNHH